MSTAHSVPLSKPQRTQLENTVKSAREVAEKGARAALSQLAVGEGRAPDYLTDELKALRRRLRAHGRALGDAKAADDTQGLQHLVWEVAYEHWHRMLFARFLAENGLLLWEPGAAVSLDDCEALVQETDPAMNLGAKTKWELAGKLAARMLPQVFKPQSPVFELAFAPEHQRELERLLAGLSTEVFQASDSLGWVYQFWQAKRKQEVNDSEVKIGADELPAVTQLFTEPYMVDFLLHNSLGAWWVTRHPGQTCPVPLTYLRTLEDGTPAAGKFEGWPDRLNEFKLLDPCCGSGHFLVAAFLLLVPMRMAAESLSASEAVDAVLAHNLYGLELDARCVEIAVFALALAAWRFPDENGDPLGVRVDMPAPQVACCGLKVAAKPADWMALVPDDAPNAAYLRQELGLLHASFAQAPLLGSLLDPARSLKNDLASTTYGNSFNELQYLLKQALAGEAQRATLAEAYDDVWDSAITARGLLDAAQILQEQYDLVATNFPYLGLEKQEKNLGDFVKANYPEASRELAACLLLRSIELSKAGGLVAGVMPSEWTFARPYRHFRKSLLQEQHLGLLAYLGKNSFSTGLRVSPILVCLKRKLFDEPTVVVDIRGVNTDDKAKCLEKAAHFIALQASWLANPDCRMVDNEGYSGASRRLRDFVDVRLGVGPGDVVNFEREFWEIKTISSDWEFLQGAVSVDALYGGRSSIFYWQNGVGKIYELAQSVKHLNHAAQNWQRGRPLWGRQGVILSQMGGAATYSGNIFPSRCLAIVPNDSGNLEALIAFALTGALKKKILEVDAGFKIASPETILDTPFDVSYWQERFAELFPKGLPRPSSNDLTQWLFHGHPQPATDPLQVAVARLAGYRWPAETDPEMELADEARTWIASCDLLAGHTDDDGIVCLPSVRGEAPAHERLLKLLIAAWETVQLGSWKPTVLDKLLADVDCAGKGLDVWLRDKFFEQHAKRFHHRPFIWHVWDGLKDGFAALVNYHQLDAKNLERLIHTYLGDWIRQQEEGVRNGVDGAQNRLSAAQDLKRRLELILEGEPPYDIFVRWKPLAEQPIGWNPDLNDGVRLNIRPFMTAEVLRHNRKPKLNIAWDKDRGKDVESAPWFKVFKGDRINDHHLTRAEKLSAKGGR